MKKLTAAEGAWIAQALFTAKQLTLLDTQIMSDSKAFTATEMQEAEWKSDIAASACDKLVLLIHRSHHAEE